MDEDYYIKFDEESDSRYGSKPEDRPTEEYIRKGIVNIDKTAGPTSHEISAWVKLILNVKKVGHSGTLDPKVTGVLPVAIDDASKVLQGLLIAGKEYVTVMKLHGEVTNSQVKKTLSMFQATLYQKPPLKSAVKRQLRQRTIYKMNYIERSGDYVLFQVDCQAGTYIRKLCHDIGLVLGVGAHMQQLRRVRAGPYTESTIVSLHDLRDAYTIYREEKDDTKIRQVIQPMESAVVHLPKIWVRDSAINSICHGAPLGAPGVARMSKTLEKNQLCAVLSLKGELVALAKSSMDAKTMLASSKGEAAISERVIMSQMTYPKKI